MMRRQKRADAKSALATASGQSPHTIPKTISKAMLGPVVLRQVNQAVGRPANPQGVAGNAQGLPLDYGPQLVELIQRTISPNSWDVNGGASTIQYWRPGMALVVRAPGDVHDELSPLLLQLRKQ